MIGMALLLLRGRVVSEEEETSFCCAADVEKDRTRDATEDDGDDMLVLRS